jgi:hypothetical protein
MLEAGEVSEEDLRDTIEAVTLEWDAKVDDIISVIKNIEAEAENIRAEEKRLAERRRKKERAAERIRAYLADAMQRLGRTRYDSARHEVSFRRSSRIRITDEEALIEWAKNNAPSIFREQRPEISKDKLRTVMDAVNVPYTVLESVDNIQIK